jgi:hypothetical protein
MFYVLIWVGIFSHNFSKYISLLYTMRKALLIGINYTGTSSALNGCLNDVANVKTMLIEQFGYTDNNIVMLTDETKIKPTKDNILSALTNFCTSSAKGDKLWLHYSGHGSFVRDTNKDESDGNDEAIVPLDYEDKGFIIDDTIKLILSKLHPDSNCVAVFDSCHSGTCGDLPYCYNTTVKKEKDNNHVAANVIMISGCRDSQTSADAHINNNWAGAVTFYLLKVLQDNKFSIRIGDLVNNVRTELKNNGYSQYPVLTSSRPINLNKFLCIAANDVPHVI